MTWSSTVSAHIKRLPGQGSSHVIGLCIVSTTRAAELRALFVSAHGSTLGVFVTFNLETASSVQAAATAMAACCLVARGALRTLSYCVLSWVLKRQYATQFHQW